MEEATTALRALLRALTARSGVLDEAFLDRGRQLAHSRVLWEIADGVTVRQLRDRLGLDSGYLSRILSALAEEGLVMTERSPDDGRVREVRLTTAGHREWASLDAVSDASVGGLLARLPPAVVGRVTGASRQLTAALLVGTASVDAVPGDDPRARWCLQQYLAEIDQRFEGGLVTDGMVTTDAHEVSPPNGLTLVATSLGEPIGAGMLKRTGDGVVDVKRVWVAPAARFAGLATVLMDRLEREAAGLGFHTIRLETNRALTEAIAMYLRRGYAEVEPFNTEPNAHHWFAKAL